MAGEWRQTSIGALCDQGAITLQTGPFGSQLHAHEYVADGVPVVPTEAIRGRRINHAVLPMVSPAKAKELERHSLRPGDILFARRGVQATGHVGFVGRAEDGFICGTGAIRLRVTQPGHEMDPRFLSFVLADPASVAWFKFHAVGATMPNLNEDIIRSFPLSIPSIPEQRAIGDILGSLDDKIELNRRLGETLEAMARAVFKSWFVDFDPVHAKAGGRNPGLPSQLAELFPDRFLDSDLGEIPEGWNVADVGAVADVIDCLHSKKPKRCSTGKPLLQLANIRDDGILDLSETYLIDDASYERWTSRMEARQGDCVITNVGRVGAVSQIPPGVTAALGRNMTGLRCKQEFPFPTFLLECLQSSPMREEIRLKTDSGTILNALNVRSIPRLRFVLPPRALLEQFELTVRPLRALMEHQLSEASTLLLLRDTLLPKLVSGELRLGDGERLVEGVG